MAWKCFFFIILYTISSIVYCADDSKTYIVHMDESLKPDTFSTHRDWHDSILTSVATRSNGARPTHLYTYNHVMSGFSAVLSPSQLEQIKKMRGHLMAYPEAYARPRTTRTPKFLGLNRGSGLWPTSRFGDDVIIGHVDTGIWPESESFDDKGMPPVPKRWKGKCGTEFGCNRKLIGARCFNKGLKQDYNLSDSEYDSPRDAWGHGTHTSSTSSGNWVRGVSYFGYAKGTAVGIAPMARVAMYKVMFDGTAATSDILAALDQAIEDGVDVISLSMGYDDARPYYKDPLAIGTFSAMEKGIFVSFAVADNGPEPYSMVDGAPWFASVGAGSIDREFVAAVSFGGSNGMMIKGRSLFPESLFVSNVSLYFGFGNVSKESCGATTLDPVDVKGKIVLCSASVSENLRNQMAEVYRAGAKGGIFITDPHLIFAQEFYMPFVLVSLIDGDAIKKYATEERTAAAVDIKFILTEFGLTPSPQIVDFSSRGPCRLAPNLLKPDILAPGLNILAAFVPRRFVRVGDDYLSTDYALLSGTSMASPHVAGTAALLRSVHRDWSPAAIKSAMMTTAYVTDSTGSPMMDMNSNRAATPLDYGAGHLDPNKAVDPGLVYDIGAEEYIDFLCGLNYSALQIQVVTRRSNYTCRGSNRDNLNYPSFVVVLETRTNSSSRVFDRVLTNVEDRPVRYRAIVNAPEGMKVLVLPEVLSFEGKNSKREFSMMVDVELGNANGGNMSDGGYLGNYGFLKWSEIGGEHVVTSPIVSVFPLK